MKNIHFMYFLTDPILNESIGLFKRRNWHSGRTIQERNRINELIDKLREGNSLKRSKHTLRK